jgi:hypothetical protein
MIVPHTKIKVRSREAWEKALLKKGWKNISGPVWVRDAGNECFNVALLGQETFVVLRNK